MTDEEHIAMIKAKRMRREYDMKVIVYTRLAHQMNDEMVQDRKEILEYEKENGIESSELMILSVKDFNEFADRCYLKSNKSRIDSK